MVPTLAAFADSPASAAAAYVAAVLASPLQIAAHLAAIVGVALVVVSAFVRTMIPLRWLAVGSNAGLLVWGVLHPSPTTAAVSALLLPINIVRAIEMTRLTRRVQRAADAADLAGLWLRPYMKPRRLRAGRTLFARGDHADRLYLLTQGEMELVEIGQRLEPGRVFGEIALFSPERVRTHTARCLTRCTLLEIDQGTVMQLYFQNPAFGLHLIRLLAGRLGRDVARLEQELQALRAATAAPSTGEHDG